MKKIFFDVTDIVRYMKHNNTISGIQRVALMLIGHVCPHLDTGQAFLSYYDDKKQKYFTVPVRDLPTSSFAEMQYIADMFSLDFKNSGDTIHPLRKYPRGGFKYLFHREKLNIQAILNRENAFKKHGITIDEWKAWRHSKKHHPTRPPLHKSTAKIERFEDVFSEGDVLCLLGLLSGSPQTDTLFRTLSQKGLEIILFVHDTIPLLLPDTVFVKPVVFLNWLQETTQYCSAYLANSKNTARDLRKFLDLVECSTEIHTLPLAQDKIPSHTEHDTTLRAATLATAKSVSEVAEGMKLIYQQHSDILTATKLPYVLCVGTMEARKNCWRIAQAWQQLTQRDDLELPRLIFAGKHGWLNDDFHRAYEKTGGWGGWVQIIEKPSDHDLNYLYENCEFSITASLYEGWGLPIGESLSHGKTAVVSNMSSMPEVGMDLVEYCNPHSITSIATACEKLIRDPEHRAILEHKIALTKLRQWSDVGIDLAKILADP